MTASYYCLRFGKFKGAPLSEVDTGYLDWCLRSVSTLGAWDRQEIEAELRRRPRAWGGYQRERWDAGGSTGAAPVADGLAGEEAAVALQIVQAGKRYLAQRYHPDAGGDASKMLAVNVVAEKLEQRFRLIGGRL